MTEVLRASRAFDSKTLFRMMNGKCEKLRDAKNETVDISGYAYINIADIDGDDKAILYFEFTDGRIYATNSPTVMRTFDSMVSAFGEPSPETPFCGVVIKEAKSRNGRNFLDIDFID